LSILFSSTNNNGHHHHHIQIVILVHDQWHLGYASLLRDCRGQSYANDDDDDGHDNHRSFANLRGQEIILTSLTADALSSSRIMSYMRVGKG
jgi:hypothetical protein